MVEFEQIVPEVGTIFKCVVYLNGLPYEINALQEAEIELEDGTGLAGVIAALRELYKSNINGQLYYDGTDFKRRPADRIAPRLPVTGG